jgi:peroxiredoxin Q/BCP
MLRVGTPAPDFSLPDEQGTMVTLSSYQGKQPVVLIFYPGDNTPVCTMQLCGVRDTYDEFVEAGAVVFGVNPGSASSHERFSQRHNFQFRLLVDHDRSVAQQYDCVMFSLGPLGLVSRTVYVVGLNGTIVFAQPGTPSTKDIVAAIQTM